jgi:hypothetical protein
LISTLTARKFLVQRREASPVQYIYEPGLEVEIQAMGVRIRVTAGFNPELPVVLLGRLDFFSQFRVLFDERAQTFTLERYE